MRCGFLLAGPSNKGIVAAYCLFVSLVIVFVIGAGSLAFVFLVFRFLSSGNWLGDDGLPVSGEQQKVVGNLSPEGFGLGAVFAPGAASAPIE